MLFPLKLLQPSLVSLFSFSTSLSPPSNPSPLSLSSLSMCSDYLSKLAISWLLYRDDVSLCPRVHQVGFLPLYLVKPKLTAGLVGVLLDLTKGLGLVLMRVNPVWFIAGLSKKINGSPFESKSLIALCTYVSSLWIFFPPVYLLLSPFSISQSLILILSLHHCLVCFFFQYPTNPMRGSDLTVDGSMVNRRIDFSLFSLGIRQGKAALSTVLASSGWDHNQNETLLLLLLFRLHPNFT